MAHRRAGMTLLELLVVIIVIGILVSLSLPAVQQARETGRRTQCQNNLREIGRALLSFHTARGTFPLGHHGLANLDHSWATAILPQLGEEALYRRYDYAHPWDYRGYGVDNLAVAETTLAVFLCPSAWHNWPGATDYGGNYGSSLTGLKKGFGVGYAWESGVLVAMLVPSAGQMRSGPVRQAEIRDGTGNTFMVVEDAGRPASYGGQWANGHQCLAHDLGTVNFQPLNGIYSDHPGGANALMADGAVRFLADDMSPYVIGALSTRARREVVDGY